MMTGHRWIACAAVALGLLGLGVDTALGAAIPPVGAPGTAVTLSVLLPNGNDEADSYLPEVTIDPVSRQVTGKSVTLRVNGLNNPAIALEAPNPAAPYPASDTTTAYRGTCTNFTAPLSDTDASGNPAADFKLDGNQLTSWDCGGTAVLVVTGVDGSRFTFRLPADANRNGIADSFEGPGTNLMPAADPDVDGHSNLDEYRGFIVSGKLVRGDPSKKDLFLFLVNPQATATSASLPAGGSLLGKLPGENRTVYPIDGTPLTANIEALASVARVHLIGHKRDAAGRLIFDGLNRSTDEMIDRLVSFAIDSAKERWIYRTTDAPTPTITITNLNRKSTPADDRVVNRNRVHGLTQKAARVIESLDVSKASPFGSCSWGSPNQLNEAVLYTRRIVTYITNLQPTAPATLIQYATHTGSAWGAPVRTFINADGTSTAITRDYIISKWIQYTLAHEAGGHDTKLKQAASVIGYHDPTDTGGMLDSQVQAIPTSNPSGLTFRIPSLFLSGHLSNVQVGTR
jgi:hypothetical protein